jgi:threonine dehydratase
MVQVSEELLALAVLRLAELEQRVVEGAGAAGLAALLSGQLNELAGRKVVLLLTGGNIDPLAHRRVIERGLETEGRIYRRDVLLNDYYASPSHRSSAPVNAGANVAQTA